MFSWTLITGDTPVNRDARAFRQSLGTFPTGVCLVTTVAHDGKREGMTINSFASVSLTPPLILWSIRDETRSADSFVSGQYFILSVLAASQRELAMHFAKPAHDKFSPWESAFDTGLGDCPRLKESVATFECTVYSRHQEGDHTIMLGHVEQHTRSDAMPLLLHMGQMGSLTELAAAALAQDKAAG
jgi:flavin reductase (DIM6/NTAB) family NADH-FMN oxidoreductase RutF